MLSAASWLLPLLALSMPQAHDGGVDILFRKPLRRIVVDAQTKPGDVLWDSGPSAPTLEDFGALIFHGLAGEPGVSFEAAADAGSGWGPWQKAEVEFFPNGRFWGKARLSGKAATLFRLRIIHQGIAAGKAVELYGIEAASLREGPPVPPSEPPPPSPPDKPGVIDRAGWGAADPTEAYVPMTPWRLTAHHTDAAQPMTLSDAVQEMQVIQRFHQRGRGWIDIGYHFLIDGAGRIFAGRPETAVGAHVRKQNEGNLGISLMGGFHPPRNQQPTGEQIDSLILLARWLVASYAIDPETLKGHRDHQATSCPGDLFYPRLDGIRREISRPAELISLPELPPLTREEKERWLGLLFDGPAH